MATSPSFQLDEPDGPVVKTAIPGPRSLELLKELNQIQVSSLSQVTSKKDELKQPLGLVSSMLLTLQSYNVHD